MYNVDIDSIHSMQELKRIYRARKTQDLLAAATAIEVAKDFFAPLDSDGYAVPVQIEQGNNPMIEKYKANVAGAGAGVIINAGQEINAASIAEDQRKFLASEALRTLEDKLNELMAKFRLGFDYELSLRPKTTQEAAARIAAGQFTIKGADKKDPQLYPGLTNVFTWRTADQLPDRDGFDAAVEDMEAALFPLLTEIRIFDPKDGLESLKKIQAYDTK